MYRREYEALGDLGFFDDDRVQLLHGFVVVADEDEDDAAHAAIHRRLTRLLIEGIPPDEGDVRVGEPLSLSDLSVPHPDFMVMPAGDAQRAADPITANLVIEVANAIRDLDLGFKAALYAAAGIPEYWVVDLVRDEVVVHREPAVKTWKSITRHREGVVRALRHPAVAVDVKALLR